MCAGIQLHGFGVLKQIDSLESMTCMTLTQDNRSIETFPYNKTIALNNTSNSTFK